VPRVLTARFMHETNTFSRVPTDMAMIRRRDFHLENEMPAAFRGTRSAIGAAFEAADKYGWTLVHPVSANPNPSGTVTDDAFETVTGMILDAVDAKGPIDGALLHLHGAMVSDSYEDAEGEFLARLRQRVGPNVPVVVTLDLHANVTQKMADNANALIAYRTYPHIDYYERAWQGAELLERAMRGEIRPKTVIARRPMLYGLDHGRTQRGPMAELIARGEALEQSGEALVVSICAGFSRANIRDVGPSVTVTVDGSPARAQTIAEEFMDYAWQTRDFTTVKLLSIAEAVALPPRSAWRQAARRRRLHRQSRRWRLRRRHRILEGVGRGPDRQCRVPCNLRSRGRAAGNARRGRRQDHPGARRQDRSGHGRRAT